MTENEIDPRIELMQRYEPAKKAVVLAKAGNEEDSARALEILVRNMDTGKDGGELLRYFKEMGPQGDEQLRVIYANAYERASAGASVGVLFEIGRASVGKECRSRWSPYH